MLCGIGLVLPSCGHVFTAAGSLQSPAAAEAQTLALIATQFNELAVAVTPIIHVSAAATHTLASLSADAVATLSTTLTNVCAAHGYSGVVFAVDFTGLDGEPLTPRTAATSPVATEASLGAVLSGIASRLGSHVSGNTRGDLTVGVVLPGARATAAFAEAVARAEHRVIVYAVNATYATNFTQFAAAVDALQTQFSGRAPVSISLSLNPAQWGGTVPSQTTHAHQPLAL